MEKTKYVEKVNLKIQSNLKLTCMYARLEFYLDIKF